MSLSFNGTTLSGLIFNGVTVDRAYMSGVVVFDAQKTTASTTSQPMSRTTSYTSSWSTCTTSPCNQSNSFVTTSASVSRTTSWTSYWNTNKSTSTFSRYNDAPSGSQTFTSNGTFTVPQNVKTIFVYMVGGGGGGAKTDDRAAGGGYAGSYVAQTISTTPGATFNVTIGGGGGNTGCRYCNGGSGSTTYFGGYAAAGGRYGDCVANNGCTYCGPQGCAYAGQGGGRVSPYSADGVVYSTYYDGTSAGNAAFGGQASAFANGGYGNITGCDCDDGRHAGPGSYGSGGGGVSRYNASGVGGNGICIVTW